MMYLAAILAIAATAGDVSPAAAPAQLKGEMPQELIDEAGKVGELSGVAEACSVSWQAHFDAYVAAKRKAGVEEFDITMLAAYHGAAQDTAYNMVSKDCTPEQKKQIQDAMNVNIKQFKK